MDKNAEQGSRKAAFEELIERALEQPGVAEMMRLVELSRPQQPVSELQQQQQQPAPVWVTGTYSAACVPELWAA